MGSAEPTSLRSFTRRIPGCDPPADGIARSCRPPSPKTRHPSLAKWRTVAMLQSRAWVNLSFINPNPEFVRTGGVGVVVPSFLSRGSPIVPPAGIKAPRSVPSHHLHRCSPRYVPSLSTIIHPTAKTLPVKRLVYVAAEES